MPRSKNEWSYASTPPIRIHGVVLNLSTGTALPLPYLSYTDGNLFTSLIVCLSTYYPISNFDIKTNRKLSTLLFYACTRIVQGRSRTNKYNYGNQYLSVVISDLVLQ